MLNILYCFTLTFIFEGNVYLYLLFFKISLGLLVVCIKNHVEHRTPNLFGQVLFHYWKWKLMARLRCVVEAKTEPTNEYKERERKRDQKIARKREDKNQTGHNQS